MSSAVDNDYSLENDLHNTGWVIAKVRGDEVYAQHLYAALCNNEFIKNQPWSILAENKWSCTWRRAGRIIAEIRRQGDYMDWYCSGMRGDSVSGSTYDSLSPDAQEKLLHRLAYVGESIVTEEIKRDLLKLGWIVAPTF